MLAAMALFLLATLACLFAPNIAVFVAFRFVQGVAGAGGVVISRSIAADRYVGHELAAMLALVGAVNGVATVAAPVGGGMLAALGGWHAIFWFLLALGAVLLAACLWFRESLPVARRTQANWKTLSGTFLDVLRNRAYLSYILQYGFAMSVLFVNIASAPFIMQQHYGFSPMTFSVCFGINAIAIVVSAAASVKFRHSEQALFTGSAGMIFFSILLCGALITRCSFWIYEILLVCLLSMLGLTFTASNTLAMDCERENAGTASALLGALGFAFGGIVSPLVGLGDIMTTTGVIFLVGSLSSFACTWYALRNRPFQHAAEMIRK